MGNVRLSIKNLDKSFSVPVLEGVNISVASGEVHAIVGENGAGKTTLVNILAGLQAKDGGELVLDGLIYEPSRPGDAFQRGVSFVAQELSIIGTLTVAENIGLRNLPQRRFVILRDKLDDKAKRLLQLVGLAHVSPQTRADEISLAERQLLELAKAVAMDCRLLVLDEPTSALSAPQAARLHEIIADLAASGTSVIYISHRLDDVLQVSDTITILRDGQVVSSVPAGTLSIADMMERMAGRDVAAGNTARQELRNKTAVLDVEDITTASLPNGISFTCHSGEIIGIAGLAGSGRSELLEALFGLVPLTGGSVTRIAGKQKCAIRNAHHAVKSGMGFLGEDRQSMGLLAGRSVLANITLPGLASVASSLGLINRARETEEASRLVDKLAIRCAGLYQDIDELSGGNQQKALIARWLQCDSEIFLLDEPTRGIDVATKIAIYELLFELRGREKAVVLASSEIDELMTVCDCILVLSGKKLVKIFVRDNWSEAEILSAAFLEFAAKSSLIESGQQHAGGP